MERGRESRFEFDDPSTLTSFPASTDYAQPIYEVDSEGVLSKFLSKVKIFGGSGSATNTVNIAVEKERPTPPSHASSSASLLSQGSGSSVGQDRKQIGSTTSVQSNNVSKSELSFGSYNTEKSSRRQSNSSVPTAKSENSSTITPTLIRTSSTSSTKVLDEITETPVSLPPAPPQTKTVQDFGLPTSPPQHSRKSLDSDSDSQSIRTTFSVSNTNSLGKVLRRLRGDRLHKDYWLPDDYSRECYECKIPFTMFRRKHHCRMCGQIFCGKCAAQTIPGSRFGSDGQIRVCNYCYKSLDQQEDDDVESVLDIYSNVSGETLSVNKEFAYRPDQQEPPPFAPRMSISAAPVSKRGFNNSSNGPTTLSLEIPVQEYKPEDEDARNMLTVPPSPPEAEPPRRLFGQGSFSRTRSNVTTPLVDTPISVLAPAPFRRLSTSSVNVGTRLFNLFPSTPSAHPTADSAPFMSDDEDDAHDSWNPTKLLNFLHGENERSANPIGTFGVERTPAPSDYGSDDEDDYTRRSRGFSQKTSNEDFRQQVFPKHIRRRSLSTSGRGGFRPRPRSIFKNLNSSVTELPESDLLLPTPTHEKSTESISRSGSMERRPGSPYSLRHRRSISMRVNTEKLNAASLLHVRLLLRQMLKQSDIPLSDVWEQVLMQLLLKIADNLSPGARIDEINVNNYIKVKKIPGGIPQDSIYVKGLVFTKNLAHKQMAKEIRQPKILIVRFPLDFSRDGTPQLLRIENVVQQEKEHIKNLIKRIKDLNPNLVIVEKSVSRMALDLLLKAELSVAYNIKPFITNFLARCTDTNIMEYLTDRPILGSCGYFYAKTFVHELIPNRRKTYLFFEDCNPELGCTLVLRGSDEDTLKELKRITYFMATVVYHLKLETGLIRDQHGVARMRVMLAEDILEKWKHDILHNNTNSKSTSDKGISTDNNDDAIQGDKFTDAVKSLLGDSAVGSEKDLAEILKDEQVKKILKDLEPYENTILSSSPFVHFPPPYVLLKLKQEIIKLASLGLRMRPKNSPTSGINNTAGTLESASQLLHIKGEYDELLDEHRQQWRSWTTYTAENDVSLAADYHQMLVVLYSNVNVATTIPCEEPYIFAFEFYQESDITLGQYIEDMVAESDEICSAKACEKPMLHHYRNYVHGHGRIIVMIEKANILVSSQDVIVMWSYCQKCQRTLPVQTMSEDTYRYSFGKYLEITFYNTEAVCFADQCQHRIHRDHIRYFGFKDRRIEFRYEDIELREVIIPPAHIFISSDKKMELKNQDMDFLRQRINAYYDSLSERNKRFPFDSIQSDKVDIVKGKLSEISRRVGAEKKQMLQNLQKAFAESSPTESLALNKVRQELLKKSMNWDQIFDELIAEYFLTEKDFRKLPKFVDFRDFSSTYDSSQGTIDNELSLLSMNYDISNTTAPTVLPELGTSPSKLAEEDLLNNRESRLEDDSDKTTSIGNSPLRTAFSRKLSMELLKESKPRRPAAQTERTTDTISAVVLPEFDAPVPGPLLSSRQVSDLRGFTAPNSGSSSRSNTGRQTKQTNFSPSSSSVDLKSLVSPPIPSTPSRLASSRTTRQSSYFSPPTSSSSTTSLSNRRSSAFERSITNKQVTDQSVLSLKPSQIRKPPIPVHTRSTPLRPSTPIRRPSLTREELEGIEQTAVRDANMRVNERKLRAPLIPMRGNPRKRLLSKASIEVFTKVDVEENSDDDDDEFHSYGVDDELDDYETHTVSLTKTDAFDESLGNELPSSSPERATNIHRYFSAMAFLGQDNDVPPETLDQSLTAPRPSSPVFVEGPSTAVGSLTRVLGSAVSPYADSGDFPPAVDRLLFAKTINTIAGLGLWTESRGISNLYPLDYPVVSTEHVFLDSLVVVREDEPTSIIAYTLDCDEYREKLMAMKSEHSGEGINVVEGSFGFDENEEATFRRTREESEDWNILDYSEDREGNIEGSDIERALMRRTSAHINYNTQSGDTKMFCKIFFAEQFDVLRKICGCDESYIISLARCVKWDSAGGKSGSSFFKTKDDRFVIKKISRLELNAFMKCAPGYFHYMSEAFFHDLPTVLVKVFGFYRIGFKKPTTGSVRMDLLVMENLFYNRNITKIFDLKGSMRNRHVQITGRQNEVLLDENLVELMHQQPLFIRTHSKEVLRGSLHNDTLFLSKLDVMDYSLLVGIDDQKQELVVGIVDFIRTFTWDKALESWVKETGILGGGGKGPTIVSPKQYRLRFREAMERYFLMVPDTWTPQKMIGPQRIYQVPIDQRTE